MKNWKSLFRKQKIGSSYLPPDFQNWIKKSIDIIGINSYEMEDSKLYELLIQNNIPEYDAGEILIFLPTAFCRKILTEIAWKPEYIDFYSEGEQVKRKFSENERYRIIELETDAFFTKNFDKKLIYAIAERSAEYKSVTKLLRNGSMPDNIEVSEPIIAR